MSNFVENKLDGDQILQLLSLMSHDKIRDTLRDLRNSFNDKPAEPILPSLPNMISDGDLQNILEIIEQKLMRENIEMDISDPED